jgi:uncharacterized protein (TIGR00251 family)
VTGEQLVRQHGTAVRLTVRVQPRASRAAIGGKHGGAWRVRVQAPPVEGAANDAVCTLLAETLGVPRRAVRVVSGVASRTKIIEVEGVTAQAVLARLSAASEDR